MIQISRIILFFFVITIAVARHNVYRRQAGSCRTPDGKVGSCIPLKQCHSLRKLHSSPTSIDLRFMKDSICSYRGYQPIVCCPRSETTQPKNPEPTRHPSKGDGDDRMGQLKNEGDCGVSGSADPRIISGEPASLDAWPWMAALYDEQFGQVFFRCGGSLINRQYILTAAHCVADRFGRIPASKFTVRLGDLNLVRSDDGASPIEVPVSEIKIHEDYNFRLNEPVMHDIALMRLSRPVTFTKSIRPICLPGPQYDSVGVFERMSPLVIGWGKTENGTDSDILRQVRLPIQSEQTCQNVYSNLPIGPTHICAGLAQGGKDSCQGDSGGPMMLTDFRNEARSGVAPFMLVGIVSTGAKCAQPGFYGIYTRVTAYRDWIQKNIA